jgi:hypothetical protein
MIANQEVTMVTTKTRVIIIEEVSEKMQDGDWLCFQFAEYQYHDGGSEQKYRFIRKGGDDGKYKAQRAQVAIDNIGIIERLTKAMKKIRKD